MFQGKLDFTPTSVLRIVIRTLKVPHGSSSDDAAAFVKQTQHFCSSVMDPAVNKASMLLDFRLETPQNLFFFNNDSRDVFHISPAYRSRGKASGWNSVASSILSFLLFDSRLHLKTFNV